MSELSEHEQRIVAARARLDQFLCWKRDDPAAYSAWLRRLRRKRPPRS